MTVMEKGRYRRMQRRKDCQLRGWWESSRKVGGCNFCNCSIRLDPPGSDEHQVFVVEGPSRGLQVRFCRHCLSGLPGLARYGDTESAGGES